MGVWTGSLVFMDIAIAIAVIFVGSYVQSSIGFGLAVIAAPILFFIDPLFVPAPVTVSALTLSLVNAAKHWHSISFSGLKFAILGRIPGTVAGGLLPGGLSGPSRWTSSEQLLRLGECRHRLWPVHRRDSPCRSGDAAAHSFPHGIPLRVAQAAQEREAIHPLPGGIPRSGNPGSGYPSQAVRGDRAGR